jgi:DNA (cytosine-5)-methyltransferase 1
MSEIKYVGQMSSSQNSRVIDPSGISYAVTNGHKDGEPKIIERDTPMKGNYKEPRICSMVGRDQNNPKSRKKADGYVQMLEIGDDVSNTLTSVQKDNFVAEPVAQEPYNADEDGCAKAILAGCYKFGAATLLRKSGATMTSVIEGEPPRIPQATKQGYVEVQPGGLFDMSYPESKTRRGRVQEGGTVSPTLMASGEGSCLYEGKVEQSYRIRKLTPKECFRLMGVSESDIEKILNSGVSQSQQYKMAGNRIVVDVLEHIFRKMFVETEQESQQLSLF